MHIEIDLAEVVTVNTAAIRLMRRVPMIIHGKVEKQASLARRTHRYRNRTHHLEQSTFARPPVEWGGPDFVMIELGARTHYAGHVEALGYQDIAGHAATADAEIRDALLDASRGL